MNSPTTLPTNLMHARWNSTCPSCHEPITPGDVIGQFGYRENYICSDCTGRALAFLTPGDPIETVVESIRNEVRLRRLLDLEVGTFSVITGQGGLTWTEEEEVPVGTIVLAQVQMIDDLLLVTRALALEPYTVAEPPD